MTSTTLNYIVIVLGSISVLVSAREIILNKKKKGIKAVTNIGWWMVVLAAFTIIFSLINVSVTKYEKELESKSLRIDLADSFKTALNRFDSSLRYDFNLNKVNQVGFPNYTYNGGVLSMSGINITANNNKVYGSEVKNYYLNDDYNPTTSNWVIDSVEVLKLIRKEAEFRHISSKDVYLFWIKGTNGSSAFKRISIILSNAGYRVIECGEYKPQKGESKKGLIYGTYYNSLMFAVGEIK